MPAHRTGPGSRNPDPRPRPLEPIAEDRLELRRSGARRSPAAERRAPAPAASRRWSSSRPAPRARGRSSFGCDGSSAARSPRTAAAAARTLACSSCERSAAGPVGAAHVGAPAGWKMLLQPLERVRASRARRACPRADHGLRRGLRLQPAVHAAGPPRSPSRPRTSPIVLPAPSQSARTSISSIR